MQVLVRRRKRADVAPGCHRGRQLTTGGFRVARVEGMTGCFSRVTGTSVGRRPTRRGAP
jgi:hypothetical protein